MTFKEVRFDFNRQKRLGMVEAVWGEHKSSRQILKILRELEASNNFALVTRVDEAKANEVLEGLDKAEFHSLARCLTLGSPQAIKEELGEVVVLSGGTSDLAVAAEAELALRSHGVKTEILLDVGVSGLHRLLDQLGRLKTAKVLIACAGMEGALPTVLAGLVPQPVIGVPISVGYGVSRRGRTSLEGMLASCSPGLLVVNIDNGYGAAMAALRILKSTSSADIDS